jgi:Photosynthesis system II assembly factor YCF48
MPTDDREQQFERALARHLRDASPDSTCPNPETLAAYHERTLPLEEMALWKGHIAGCARCQETLALLEHSEDVPVEDWETAGVHEQLLQEMAPTTLRASASRMPQAAQSAPPTEAAVPGEAVPLQKPRRRPPWRWIAPLGALAACAIAWVGVREIQIEHGKQAASVEMARNQQPPAPLTPPPAAPAEQLKDQREKEELESTASTPDSSAHDQRQNTPVMPEASARPAPSVAMAESAGRAEGRQKQMTGPGDGFSASSGVAVSPSVNYNHAEGAKKRDAQGDQAAPAPVPAPAAPASALTKSADALGNTPVPGERPPASVTESVEVTAAAPTVQTSAASELTILPKNEMNLVQLAATDHRVIVAPGEKNAWRVGEAGKIERSTDHGKTWKLEKSGVTADLTAGSATADKVSWVVGKSGTILLTTDGGKHWKQITSPISGDLGGIHATDALHASVWDVPNRQSFETSDGGVTWTRTGNE